MDKRRAYKRAQKARAMQKLLQYQQNTPQDILDLPHVLYVENGELVIRLATSDEITCARILRESIRKQA